ncbi:MAG: carbohydrate-binding domain-containing protein [Clostridia bacterium]|nr:carbohydrate-binding domain-containing protein [Clostridia bacterium]
MKIKLLCILLCLGLVAVGCSDKQPPEATGGTAAPVEVDFAATDTDMFTERDDRTEYDESQCTMIELNGDSVSASASGVTYENGTVNITADGTYLLRGTLDNGTVAVNAPQDAKMQIILSGAHITSSDYAALHIVSADKVFLTLADGSENSLTNGGTFNTTEEDNVDGALFSKQDLTINGSGSLSVTSTDHGIVCKGDMVFTGGSLTVAAASHGVDANDSVRIKNTTLDITAGKDGIHVDNSDDEAKGFFYMSDGTLNIEAEGDGISASAYGQIEDGKISILAGGGSENGAQQNSGNYGDFPGMGGPGGMGGGYPGGGRRDAQTQTTAIVTSTATDDSTSMKGIKTGNSLLISGGNIKIDSADDGLHSNLSMVINGGTFDIASGDDGVHAEETLEVTACTMTISECYEGLEALHIKVSGGDIDLTATDDGLNAAGGTDASGTGGRDNGNFGGRGPGGMGGLGGMSAGNGSIVVSGGKLHINSSGDGIDANGTLEISGGYTVVVGPTQGDTATLDYDTSGIITGGTFIGTGASGMAQTFSDSENQGVIAVSVGNQSAGTEILLTDKDGNEIISYAPELNYAVVILSSPDIAKGQTYTITVGDQSAEFEAS